MHRAEIVIHGKVQGVFFRRFIRDNALQLNLNGYARNISDGTVEAIVEGDLFNIKCLIEKCRKGPPSSKVKKVDVTYSHARGEGFFHIKY